MSFTDGWAAMNLEMPARVPRTEYSLEMHWDLLARVAGLPVTLASPSALKRQAVQALYKSWNYDFFWSILVGGGELGPYKTDMGHAEYMAGGEDRRETRGSPFRDIEDVLRFDPMEKLGPPDPAATTRRFEAHYRANAEANPGGVNMTGIYTTAMSGLIDLYGWDLLLTAAGAEPARFGEMTLRYVAWMQRFFDALAAADVPVVMVHDDIVWSSGPFLRPDWYRRFVFPAYRAYFRPLIETGKKIIFTSDGDYTLFIDDIAACGVHGFVLEPMTDMAHIAQRYGRSHVFIGNADTRVLLSGSRAAIRAEVERCMAIGKPCPGFFMAVGNHIPPNTPVENALYYNEVYESLSRR